MERLTVKGPSGLISLKDKSENGANQAIKCLSEYEDTGLTPEQIRELKERDMRKRVEINAGVPICPVCGRRVVRCYDFCPDCGQRLKQEE